MDDISARDHFCSEAEVGAPQNRARATKWGNPPGIPGGCLKPFDASGSFQTIPATGGGELRRLAVRGAGVTIGTSAVAFLIQIVLTVVLARLLTPADFGLVTMATTFSLLFASIGLNGFTEAVIQREKLSHGLASNLFWINVSIGMLLTVGFAGAGTLLAHFYREPRVANVAAGLSATIFLNSAAVLHMALLKRGMRFSALSINDLIGRGVQVIVAIALAIRGWGYWALVAGAIAACVSTLIGAYCLCWWIPARPRRVEGTGSVLRFALNIASRFGVSYFTRNLDNLLVGWRLGSAALGFYKKAYDLFVLSANQLLSPISAVVLGALARSSHDQARYRRFFLGGLSILALVGMGLGAYLTLIGKDLIRLLLGPGWEPAGQIFTLFGPGVGMMLIYNTHSWIHFSIGRADRGLRWSLVEFSVIALFFGLALPFGPAAVALAWTASFWVLIIPAFWYAGKPIGFEVTPVLLVIWKYLVASALAGGATALTLHRIPYLVSLPHPIGELARMALNFFVLATYYVTAVAVLHRGFGPFRQLAKLLSDMLPQRLATSTEGATQEPCQKSDQSRQAEELCSTDSRRSLT